MIVLLHRDVKLVDFSYWNYDISQYNATMLKASLKKSWWTKRKKILFDYSSWGGYKKNFDCIFKYHLFTFLHWKFNATNFCTSQMIRVHECNKLKGHMKIARCERYCTPTFWRCGEIISCLYDRIYCKLIYWCKFLFPVSAVRNIS